MYDYDGDFSKWQDKLDAAGIDFDVTNLCGCTLPEIDTYVSALLKRKKALQHDAS